jgi:DNA-binding MarR family transcriptional regulator
VADDRAAARKTHPPRGDAGRSARDIAADERAAARPALARTAGTSATPAATGELDRLVHERLRLGILSALATGETLSFNDLKAVLGATDGNVSVHARKLEEAGYVSCTKGFDGRVPRTEYQITAEGQAALDRYLDHMEALIRAARRT